MRTEFIASSSPRWDELLATVAHDFYHLPAYVRFAADRQEPGQPLAFAAEEDGHRFFVPLIVRTLPPGIDASDGLNLDAACSRGYPGPLFGVDHDHPSTSFGSRAMQAFVSGLRERGIVTALVRIHPLLRPPAGVLEQIGQVIDHGRSVSIDLTLSVEALWQQTRQNHRRDIQQAARRGFVVRIDETWDSLGAFVAIYQESMDRLDAAAFWRLSRDYFEGLRSALAGHIHLCVAEIEGEIAAAALLIEEDGLVEYHLAGTADAHVSLSPSKSIVDFATRWAKARGNHTLHLAGSLRTGDSLNHFKVGFSPRQHPVETWRIVADPDAYAMLQARWARTRGPGLPQPDGYFPAYRQP